MTRKITDGIPTDYLRGILQACVQDSLRASDPVEQLQRFAAAGCTYFLMNPIVDPADEREQLEAIAAEILPRLARG